MKNCRKIILLVVLIMILVPAAYVGANKSHDAAVTRNLSVFNAIIKELEMNYVDSIRTDETFETAIAAMLMQIDPYTEYYTPEAQEAFETMTSGEYGGIGSYIMERDGWTYISGPYEGSPAATAGLKSGDKIIRIDTINLKGKRSDEVSALLKGQPGTIVEVEVVRPYSSDSVKVFNIERKKLQLPSVSYYGVIRGNTGYIKLTAFRERCAEEVRMALEEFKKNPEVKNIILDLRGNGGGLLESAVEIVGYFVPKGTEVLRTRGKDKSSEKIYKTSKKPIFPDIPLAILIDGASASASEITAGAMQDLDRAVLIGSRSFGKGLVQSTRLLPYEGLLKVTVAKYYIPSGRLIQALDYSHRNPDGSVARTPDSLTNVFKTAHGRDVRDGGGLIPDITIDWGKMNRLVYNIIRDHWAFDFGTKFASEHDSICLPFDFEITDEIYADFKNSIDPEKFKYDKACEDMIKQLRETAEAEGYMNDETRQRIDELALLLTHNLDKDLDTHRTEISRYIASEILNRFYYEKGVVINDLKYDAAVDSAVLILNDNARLKKILNQ